MEFTPKNRATVQNMPKLPYAVEEALNRLRVNVSFLGSKVKKIMVISSAKLSTWLYRIALNECLTFLNKQRAASTVSLDDPEADALQKLESDPYFSGDKAEMALQKALLALPEKQRMVFNLKYYQEMKYEEMSDIFGTSVGALKASYHHAVKKIEKFLGEEY